MTADLDLDQNWTAAIARASLAREATGPIVGHLIEGSATGAFSEAVIARTLALLGGAPTAQDPAMREHLHARALEWRFTEALEERVGCDPVLPPFFARSLGDPVAAAAVRAQARFAGAMRAMRLDVADLPAPLFAASGSDATYDEAATREAVLARLTLRQDDPPALGDAGLALWLTSVAIGCEHPRDDVVRALDPAQRPLLALLARACGRGRRDVEASLVALHGSGGASPRLPRLPSVDDARERLREAFA